MILSTSACGVLVRVLHELELRAAGAGDQDLLGAAEKLHDLAEVLRVFGTVAGTDGATLVVQVGMLVGRVRRERLDVVAREVDDVRFGVIEPDNCVVVGHRRVFPWLQ
jgi:hypothetical protein